MPIMLYTIILSPLWSSVTNAYINNDFAWLKTTIKRLNILSFIFIGGIIVMVFISDFIIKLWIGDKIKVPFGLTILMAIYSMMNIFIAPYSHFVNGTGKLRLTMVFSIIGITLYFFSIYLFGHRFNDSSGVLIAIIIPYVLFNFIQPFQTYKILNKTATGILLK